MLFVLLIWFLWWRSSYQTRQASTNLPSFTLHIHQYPSCQRSFRNWCVLGLLNIYSMYRLWYAFLLMLWINLLYYIPSPIPRHFVPRFWERVNISFPCTLLGDWWLVHICYNSRLASPLVLLIIILSLSQFLINQIRPDPLQLNYSSIERTFMPFL